ncbi:MAG: outer membrane protein [Micropepsaceae bacterium]
MTKHALLASVFALGVLVAPASADWSGLYVGGHVGGIWGDIETTTTTDSTLWFGAANADFSPSGVIGGGQIGYDFQFSNWVVGVELSGSVLDLEEIREIADETFAAEVEWLGIAALRAGWLWNQRSLVYLKGGYATGSVQTSAVDVALPQLGSFSTDEMHGGWMAGAGFEHMLSPDVSAAIEYNYIDLGNQDHTGVSAGTVINDVEVQTHAVSVRLNWRFWSP